MSITEKYSSEFAKLYKEKLTADVEGREWVMPPYKPKDRRLESNSTPSMNRPASGSNQGPVSDKERNESYFAVRK